MLACHSAALDGHASCHHPAALMNPGDDNVLGAFVDHEARNYTGDRFGRFVAELHHRVRSLLQRCGGRRHAAAAAAARAVAAAGRNAPVFDAALRSTISSFACTCSPDPSERMGGVVAIDELAESKTYGEQRACGTSGAGPTARCLLLTADAWALADAETVGSQGAEQTRLTTVLVCVSLQARARPG